MLDATGAVDLAPFSRVHLEEHGGRSFAVKLFATYGVSAGTEVATFVSTAFRLTVEGVETVRDHQPDFFFVVHSVCKATCSTASCTPTPQCLAPRLISSSRATATSSRPRDGVSTPLLRRRGCIFRSRQRDWIAKRAARTPAGRRLDRR